MKSQTIKLTALMHTWRLTLISWSQIFRQIWDSNNLENDQLRKMVKKFNQLEKGAVPEKHMVISIDNEKLTDKEKGEVREYANLIKEKIYGIIKGILYDDGSKLNKYLE